MTTKPKAVYGDVAIEPTCGREAWCPILQTPGPGDRLGPGWLRTLPWVGQAIDLRSGIGVPSNQRRGVDRTSRPSLRLRERPSLMLRCSCRMQRQRHRNTVFLQGDETMSVRDVALSPCWWPWA